VTAVRTVPDWDRLYDLAASQDGLFTTEQAKTAGYSPELLIHHVGSGKFLRVRRGIYRICHFPAGEYEDLVATWLWSEQQGTFSHQTALLLHGLSDVLPSRAHLTLPSNWRRRRLRIPAGLELHYADVAESQRNWVGSIPVTSPLRTLADCASAHLSRDLLEQAIQEANTRGIVSRAELQSIGLGADCDERK
jgi:predicted transcriptional regulator of viral defense system